MADIEKVIKGFEQCWGKEPNTRNCNDCPYKQYLHESRGESCADRMHLDALELLKVSVSQNVVDQFRWERDTAIKQLSEIGKGLGEKMDDIAKIVRCKDCEYSYTEGFVHERLKCEKHPEFFDISDDWFCADCWKA